MIRKLLPHPLLSLVLLGIWLLLNNTLAPGHIVLGGALAILIPYASSAFWPEQVCLQRPFLLVKFIGRVMLDILIANLLVARLILGSNRKLQPAFIRYRLRLQSPLAISILANTISLTPGTVSCDLSADRRYLLIHSLHVDDMETTVREIRQRYEQPLLEVVKPC